MLSVLSAKERKYLEVSSDNVSIRQRRRMETVLFCFVLFCGKRKQREIRAGLKNLFMFNSTAGSHLSSKAFR